MKIGYARVSTQDRSTDLQLDCLEKVGCERIFSETASGAQANRPELAKALEFARSGDTIVVWKLDRLARSMKQLYCYGRAAKGPWRWLGEPDRKDRNFLSTREIDLRDFCFSGRIRKKLNS